MSHPVQSPQPQWTAPGAVGRDQSVSVWFLAGAVLRGGRLAVTLAVIAALIAGSLSYFFSPRMYVASATFIPQQPTQSQSLLGQLAPQLGIQLGAPAASSPEFYASLMQSKELLRDVATSTYHLAGPPSFDGDLLKYYELEAEDHDRAVLLAVKRVRGMLNAGTDRSTGVVSFDVTAPDPQLAVQVADRFLELVNEYNLRRQQAQAGSQRSFFESRLDVVRLQLDSAEDAYAGFLNRNRSFEASPALRAEAGRLERQVSLRQQLFLSLTHDYEVARLEELRNTPVIVVIQHPEGFVERKKRGTVVRAAVALVLGGLAGVFLAFGREYLQRLKAEGQPEYAEFRQAAGAALAGLRRRMGRS